jgi:hypothetical protein
VVEPLGLLVGQLHDLACTVCKSLIHLRRLPPTKGWKG